ncbi:MAG: hypothetical protein KDB14_15730 [Planctomycetales bacterium]|nr:hypothetical protein [Planctomycetales bacterium]
MHMRFTQFTQFTRRRGATFTLLTLFALMAWTAVGRAAETDPAEAVDYQRQVAPLLQKYCAGCHNAADREGGLSLQTFAALQRGGEHGAVLVPGNPDASRLTRLLRGMDEPLMPPEDSPQPTAEESALLVRWIEQGARGPAGAEPAFALRTPKIKPMAKFDKPITALDWAANGLIAMGSFGRVELRSDQFNVAIPLGNPEGKVACVRFSKDGSKLVTTSGATGLTGWAGVWDTRTGKLLHSFRGHHDSIHVATLSPDGKLLATGSYDRKIILWDVATQAPLRELTGHNGAVYDLDFSPDGASLASASADDTIKVWRVSDGLRLDTLSQPLKEQYTVRFSPDGDQIVAGGADNRIRVWQFVSRDAQRINPLLHARFAHEGAVSHLRFLHGGRLLLSVAEDRTLKLWDTSDYSQVHLFPAQPDVVSAVAVSPFEGDRHLLVGRMDGAFEQLELPELRDIASRGGSTPGSVQAVEPEVAAGPAAELQAQDEREPNNTLAEAQSLQLPAVVKGVIAAAKSQEAGASDEDLFRFHANAGQSVVMEISAARNMSQLDSRIEVLDGNGVPVQRALLQALRDSYFTFRGKDSTTSGDFRVHNWEEMELNEFLYCNGEVVKLWHYPRGPDSGFLVYPGEGNRHTYFGTSAMAHALHEPCYIVRPLPVGAAPLPNGLPLFPVYFENDDDPLREWGSDSRLTFVAPADGDYFVRVTDIRGEQGEKYHYELTVRSPQPGFEVSLAGANPTINVGSGKEFTLNLKRIDGFDGPVEVTLTGLPDGIQSSSPITIEAGQFNARGVIRADSDAKQPTDEQLKQVRVIARATIHGQTVEREVNSIGAIKVAERPKILVRIVRSGENSTAADGPVELTIAPGETITAEVVAERLGYDGRISLGSHDAGRNLPHGVFVDNIGLNGLMIVEGQTRREFFITAAPFVPEQTRTFFLRTGEEGNQTTQPVLLHVRRK